METLYRSSEEYIPELPTFQEDTDSIDKYLCMFETRRHGLVRVNFTKFSCTTIVYYMHRENGNTSKVSNNSTTMLI